MGAISCQFKSDRPQNLRGDKAMAEHIDDYHDCQDNCEDCSCNKESDRSTVIDNFLEDIASINEEAQYPTDLKDAIIGRVERFGTPTLILLDREKCLQIFMERDGMTREDAEEFFEFNVIGSWVGEGTPCFATLLE